MPGMVQWLTERAYDQKVKVCLPAPAVIPELVWRAIHFCQVPAEWGDCAIPITKLFTINVIAHYSRC